MKKDKNTGRAEFQMGAAARQYVAALIGQQTIYFKAIRLGAHV